MPELTPEEQRLFDKYGMGWSPMNPALNTTVQVILDSDRLADVSGMPDTTALFDPAWSLAMHARAEQAAGDLRFAIARGLVTYEEPGGDAPYNPDDPADVAVLANLVGTDTVYVVRHRRHDASLCAPVDYYGGLLQLFDEMHRAHYEFCVNPCQKCNVGIAAECGRGPTVLLPHVRGHLLLVFEVCEVCRALAGKIADTNYQIAVMEARGKVGLPPLGEGTT